MRRNDYDVTDSIRTTDPQAVGTEVFRIYRELYNGTPVPELERAFPDHAALYAGRNPDYLRRCAPLLAVAKRSSPRTRRLSSTRGRVPRADSSRTGHQPAGFSSRQPAPHGSEGNRSQPYGVDRKRRNAGLRRERPMRARRFTRSSASRSARPSWATQRTVSRP